MEESFWVERVGGRGDKILVCRKVINLLMFLNFFAGLLLRVDIILVRYRSAGRLTLGLAGY